MIKKIEVCATEVYESCDRLVFPLICSALEKMAHCPVSLSSLFGDRALIEISDYGWLLKKLIVPKDLKFKFPSKSCKDFYLLADLHGGLDGRLWLACSTKF